MVGTTPRSAIHIYRTVFTSKMQWALYSRRIVSMGTSSWNSLIGECIATTATLAPLGPLLRWPNWGYLQNGHCQNSDSETGVVQTHVCGQCSPAR